MIAGPAPGRSALPAVAVPMAAKIPVPITAPMPSIVRSTQVSVRFSACSRSSASRVIWSTPLVRNSAPGPIGRRLRCRWRSGETRRLYGSTRGSVNAAGRARRATFAGLAGTKVDVVLSNARQSERRLPEIRAIVMKSRLSPAVQEKSLQAFERLVRAEARVHRIAADKVHLHEVGAVDAIVDIVGTMIGMEALGWPRVVCSPLHVGRGLVSMAHGTFPVPPPAVTELLRGRPVYATHVEGE